MQRKQKFKTLILSSLSDFHLTEILTVLDRLSRRHYDLIIVIGDLPEAVGTSLDSTFESALIAFLPETHDSFTEDSAGIENFNLKKYHFSSRGTILGYGTDVDNPAPVDIDKYVKFSADILVSVLPPVNFNMDHAGTDRKGKSEVNRYIAFQKPKVLFHGGRKRNAVTKIGDTLAISVYGIQEFSISFMK